MASSRHDVESHFGYSVGEGGGGGAANIHRLRIRFPRENQPGRTKGLALLKAGEGGGGGSWGLKLAKRRVY